MRTRACLWGHPVAATPRHLYPLLQETPAPSGPHPGPPSHSLGLLRGLSWRRRGLEGVSGPLLRPPGAAAISMSICLQGRGCGLCGNFDDNALNDFTTRSQSVVGDVLEFGNSWKFSPSCPDALAPRDPCTANPSRRSWAQKQCSIINSATFSACHTHVRGAPPGTWGGSDGSGLGSHHPLRPAVAAQDSVLQGKPAQVDAKPRGCPGAPQCLKPLSPTGGAGQVLRGLRERRLRLRLGGRL